MSDMSSSINEREAAFRKGEHNDELPFLYWQLCVHFHEVCKSKEEYNLCMYEAREKLLDSTI